MGNPNWVPGVSGHPGGRSTEKPFLAALKLEIAEARQKGPRSLRRIARKLLNNAENGETAAIREIADRLDGKIPQPAPLQPDENTRLIIEIRSFPRPASLDEPNQNPQLPIIDHRPNNPPDAEIVELPPFLPPKP